MNRDYWQQQGSHPLYPDTLWSRPETRQGAGKLLIIGGQAQEFSTVAECFAAAEKAGAGTVRVIMPESTRKWTGMLPNIEYAPANQSGSFSRKAIAELLDAAAWSDGVLLAGDLGKNSETSLMLDHYALKYGGQLLVTGNALTSISLTSKQLVSRDKTTLILGIKELQQLGIALESTQPVTSGATNAHIAELLHSLTEEFTVSVVLQFNQTVWTASNGQVSSTAIGNLSLPPVVLASTCAVWAIQQPEKAHQALSTAVYCLTT